MVKVFFKQLIILLSCLYLITTGCSSSPDTDPSEPSGAKKYLIGTYYYLWYPGNWRSGYINGRLSPPQLPALGQYDSSDLKTIEQHISWSSQYGIDFWAVSWWPDQPELDRILRKKILRAKNLNDIKFCIFYETAGLGLFNDRIEFTPERTKKLISDFKFLAKNYFSHPSYLKIKGRPVVIIYLTRTFTGEYAEAVTGLKKALQEMGFNPFLIGDEIFWYVIYSPPLLPSPHPNISRIKLFDAITAYNMYDWARPNQMGFGNRSTFLSDVYNLYQEYQSAIGKKIKFIPSIIPGYNDRGVRHSENHPVIPRQFQPDGEEGSFFSQALRRTVLPFINTDIPMALITSFNEWNEGTQIEPTHETGFTKQDQSPNKTEFTKGFAYQGYGEKYLSILQDTFMAVSGRVIDQRGGRSLSQVSLNVFQKENLKSTTRTGSQGFYNLSRLNLPPGNYEVRVNYPGYQEIRTKIQIVENKTAILNLQMDEK
ncbi:MAG: carboxypeptidase regulatory-like domain-containing protein [Pseudomonadota bacterium]